MMTVRAQLLVPSANREELLRAFHDSAHGGGHLGVKKTAEKISERFYWPRWRASITAYCKECQLCDQRKQPSTTPKAELVSSSELNPMQQIEIDVLGGLPMTHTGKRYIFSRLQHIYQIYASVANAFSNHSGNRNDPVS